MREITSSDKVLLVDDEDFVLKSLFRCLRFEKYEKFFVKSGEEALDVLKKHEISVLVTDLNMPKMWGMELIDLVVERYPKVVIIVLSALDNVTRVIDGLNDGQIFRYMNKPWKREILLPTLRQAIEYYHLRAERKEIVEKLSDQNNDLKILSDELESYKRVAGKSIANRTKIIEVFMEKVRPFVTQAMEVGEYLKTNGAPEKLKAMDLNGSGMQILDFMKKVDEYLHAPN